MYQSQYVFEVVSARSKGSVRRLKSFGTRSAMNGSAQISQRAARALLHEHELPVVEAQGDQVAVVREVDEALARALSSSPVRNGSRL